MFGNWSPPSTASKNKFAKESHRYSEYLSRLTLSKRRLGTRRELRDMSRLANNEKGGIKSRPLAFTTNCASRQLLLTRVTDQRHVRDLQVAVLSAIFLHAAVFGRFFRILFHVVHLRVRHYALGGNGVAYMTRQISAAVIAHFPGAPIVPGQQELFGAVALGQTSGDGSHFRLGFGISVVILRNCPRGSQAHNNQAQKPTVQFGHHCSS